MRRALLPTKAFLRTARRLARKNPAAADEIEATLEALTEDAHQVALRTHKLKGQLSGSWACTAGYDLRVVFRFVQHEGSEAILLEAVGTHDEVY